MATLKVHETTLESGELSPTLLTRDGGALAIADAEGSFVLPEGAVDAVMRRYGAALEPAEPLLEVGALDLGDGRALRHVRHLAVFDVIARDYLVYEAPGREPICALATSVAGALVHLARAASSGG